MTAINGQTTESAADLQKYLFSRQVGERVTLTINRAGQTQALQVTSQRAPSQGRQGNRRAAQSSSMND